ncbi:MAG TPA: N-acetyl-1-D-myo-inositol-2-amino-2-deoxy-alpha-D-glucopyranoside deacetylase, partial [Actinopolymorphaceae bacterium]
MSVSGQDPAPTADRRLLLLHAHPDDETIGNGVTMAKYAAEGAHVTLVTSNRGDEGEIIPSELAHLAADRDDALGEYRIGELAAALKALGVTDHRWLGGVGRYRDSGMIGTPPNERPDCFWRADLLEAANHLVPIIREVRPQVLVTYDDFGGYGHPDHIQAHRVAMYAVQLAAVPSYRPELGDPWDIAKVYWSAMSESKMRASL